MARPTTRGPRPPLKTAAAELASLLQRSDSWQNVATKLGVDGKDPRGLSRFVGRCPRDRHEIERLYEQDDIFPLIVDRVPEHGTRRWIRMTGAKTSDGKVDRDFSRTAIEALETVEAQFKIFELWRSHRLSGGGAGLLGADDGQSPDKELDLTRVRSFKYINILSRWDIYPGIINRDYKSPNFRQPDFYTVNGSPDRIHHSRVIRLPRHLIASDLSLYGQQGWDVPIIERVYDPMRQFGTLLGYVEAIFQDLSQGVVTIKGLAKMLSSDDGTDLLKKRLQTMAFGRSVFNMILLDEDEGYERRNQAPTGLGELIIRFMDRLAAASEMPLSILFGAPPTGLSTDNEGGRRSFYDSVATKQRRLLRKPITTILEVLIAAKDGPFKGKAPKEWSFEFLPLEEPNEKEMAETESLEAETEERLLDMGVLSREEIRSKYANDPASRYQINHELDDALSEIDAQEREAAVARGSLNPAPLVGTPTPAGAFDANPAQSPKPAAANKKPNGA